MEIKTKLNKWDLLKLKSFCTSKKTINRMKRQLIDWEKTFANDVTDSGLVSKIYKQLMTLSHIKTDNPLKKWAEDPNKHFSKDVHMANGHMKRCSTLLIIIEIQIKTTMRYHLTPARIAIIKKYPQTISVGEGMERREPSYTVGGNVNWYSHCGEQHGDSLKN